MVRCKFTVGSKSEASADGLVQLVLYAVNRGDADGPSEPSNPYSAEDSVFGRFTPNGSISVGIRNPSASQQFEVGKSYYVDFTLVDG